MARTRMIKPAFFKHAELFQAEQATRLPLRIAFAGLWTVADRAGRFRWKVDLKPDVLPYDSVDMMKVLDALEQYGFIVSYVVDGKRYGFIPSFSDHQTFHKTERASTLPAPILNGESTVRHMADTVTGTVTQLVVIEDSDSTDSVPTSEVTALSLAIWSNGAITDVWGEQPAPLTPAGAEGTADALRTAGVEPEIARRSIYAQCRAMKQRVPPRSANYFRKGIEQAWEQEKVRRAGSSEKAPPQEETQAARPMREHWSDKKAREEREEGQRVLAAQRGGNVEQRKLKPDGRLWWSRMLAEAKAAGAHPVLYAFDRMNEPAEIQRASA